MRPWVALVSDFGRADSYVAEMHAAVLRRVPSAHVLHASHDVPPYDRATAALVIERTVVQLPRGAALAAVVDPGVGTARRAVFARVNGVWLVGPDNGVLPVPRGVTDTWVVRAHGLITGSPGVTTFDGRELFAPLAALLAAGLAPALAGDTASDITPCVLPADAAYESGYATGVVLASDRYGNAVTNLRPPAGTAPSALAVVEPARFAGPLRRAYGEVAAGQPLALVGSSGRVELAVREGPSGAPVAGTRVVVRCGS